MLTAAIPLRLGNNEWMGGLNYFRNLLLATNKYSQGRFRILVLTDRADLLREAAGDFSVVLDCPELNWRKGLIPLTGRAFEKLGGYNFSTLQLLERHKVDLISHYHIGNQNHIPSLPWIFDFQHRALPHLFSAKELQGKERYIAVAAQLGHLLVSSESAHRDFRQWYPDYSAVRVHVLPFASMGIKSAAPEQQNSLKVLSDLYQLPERFLYLPNQFWQHKNHGLVIEALAKCSRDVTVVCTGSTKDSRDPTYFASIRNMIERLGLQNQMRMLGVVPYAHVMSLMQHAVAVVNPSRFEGWSTTVEEAKLLGKRLLLSSIPVHVEQAGEGAEYFDPDDPAGLAALLEKATATAILDDSEREPGLAIAATIRQQTFIEKYHQIISELSIPA